MYTNRYVSSVNESSNSGFLVTAAYIAEKYRLSFTGTYSFRTLELVQQWLMNSFCLVTDY